MQLEKFELLKIELIFSEKLELFKIELIFSEAKSKKMEQTTYR